MPASQPPTMKEEETGKKAGFSLLPKAIIDKIFKLSVPTAEDVERKLASATPVEKPPPEEKKANVVTPYAVSRSVANEEKQLKSEQSSTKKGKKHGHLQNENAVNDKLIDQELDRENEAKEAYIGELRNAVQSQTSQLNHAIDDLRAAELEASKKHMSLAHEANKVAEEKTSQAVEHEAKLIEAAEKQLEEAIKTANVRREESRFGIFLSLLLMQSSFFRRARKSKSKVTEKRN